MACAEDGAGEICDLERLNAVAFHVVLQEHRPTESKNPYLHCLACREDALTSSRSVPPPASEYGRDLFDLVQDNQLFPMTNYLEAGKRTVWPVAADRRAASRISVTVTFVSSEEGASSFAPSRITALRYESSLS